MIKHKLIASSRIFGPIFLSACSVLLSFLIFQPIAIALDPSFHLLASKGVGKIVFSTIALLHIILFLSVQTQKEIKKFINTCFYFFWEKNWMKTLSKYFFTFFALHWLVLIAFYFLGIVSYQNYQMPLGIIPGIKLGSSIWFGLAATFFLAWSEESIFRGMFYQYFSNFWQPFPSLIASSFCFMIVHDLANPINLFTKDWKIGLGLFLLGTLLNTIFVITQKLYTGMGVHMGLVMVKVILRRIPFLTFVDLRQSNIVHLLFAATILFLILLNRKKVFPTIQRSTAYTQEPDGVFSTTK